MNLKSLTLFIMLIISGFILFGPRKVGTREVNERPEPEDPRIKLCEDWVMQDLHSRFLNSGDDLHTALFDIDDTGVFGENKQTAYVQIKAPAVKHGVLSLSDADRLNTITWSAIFQIRPSVYRVARNDSDTPRWGGWTDCDKSVILPTDYLSWTIVEKTGHLTCTRRNIHFGNDFGGFSEPKKPDVLPESLRPN